MDTLDCEYPDERRPNMSPETKIALLSLVVAMASAYFAWASSRTAKRALKIAEDDALTKRESIQAYLDGSFRWRKGGEEIYASFACRFTNISNNPTTIEKIELIVYAYAQDGEEIKIMNQPVGATPANSELAPLTIPLNFLARTTASGWLTFEISQAAKLGLRIDRYEIVATTWSGNRLSLDTYLIMDVAAND